MLVLAPFLVILFHILEVVDHGFAYFGWTFYIMFCIVGAYHRYKIRGAYGVSGNLCIDFISQCLCFGCAVTQQSVQVCYFFCFVFVC